MIVSRIKSFFKDQSKKIDNIYNEVRATDHHVFSLHKAQIELFNHIVAYGDLGKQLAAISKRISSIEMEMLIQRNACLDNNFEGKQDM